MFRLLLGFFLLASPTTAMAKDWHSDRYHKKVTRVCEERKTKPTWAKGYSAIAQEPGNLHCGWVKNKTSLKEARAVAVTICNRKAQKKCKVVWARKY